MKSASTHIALFLVTATLILAGCDSSQERSAELQRDIGTVTVEIDFGPERKAKSIDVVCSPDSTVLLSLERAQNLNKLKFEHRGTGETVFVTSIDGIDNEGGGGNNWIYRVNGELGDKSAGVLKVSPSDRITWSYGSKPDDLN